MDVKGEVLLQFFNKSKLRNRTNKFSLFIVKFKKLGFSAPLKVWAIQIFILLPLTSQAPEKSGSSSSCHPKTKEAPGRFKKL